MWKEGYNISEIHKMTGYDYFSIRKVLKENNITEKERIDRGRQSINHSVIMINKDTDEVIQAFPSIQAAYNWLNKPHSGHIASVCKGKRKSAYGYKWSYIE